MIGGGVSCRERLAVALAVFLAWLLPQVGFGGPAPCVTRWRDPQGHPKASHMAQLNPTPLVLSRDLASATVLGVPRASQTNRICLIVHTNVLAGSGAAITNFMSDLAADGYVPLLYAYSSGSAEALRKYLAALYAETGSLKGAILIGDLPYIIYEMTQNWGTGDEYEDFPCDIFFMDLDGTWADTNQTAPFSAGKYDTRSGNLGLEIWVSRLKADNLPALGSESNLVNAYFSKDHRYRNRQLCPFRRALVYNDDDWADMMPDDAEALGWNYGDDHLRVVRDPDSTTASDYRNHMTNIYETMFVRSHGSPSGHGFYENSRSNFNYVTTAEYLTRSPPALFYSFYVCSGCDYSTTNDLGGLVVLNTNDSGLVAWGSTKTGGIWEDRFLYGPLAAQQSVGDAFVAWFNEVQTLYPSYAPRWWYGMVIMGDGSLRFSLSQPLANPQAGAGEKPEIRFNARQGSRYEVRRTVSLDPPAWTNVSGEFMASNYTPAFVDSNLEVFPAFYAVVSLENGPSNLLGNASYEVSGSADARARYWEMNTTDTHGDAWGSAVREDWRCHQGAAAAAVRGSWSGSNYGGWWQEGAAEASKTYQATAWFWADHAANTWTAAVQELKIEFYSSSYSLLGSNRVGLADVEETWTQKTVRATAPAGTSWARFVVNVSGAGSAGALQLDQTTLTQVPDP